MLHSTVAILGVGPRGISILERLLTLVEGHYKQKYNKVNSLFVIILYEST
ncbi:MULTISPECIES: hypothetical protein [unclassified Bartonella]